MALGFSTADHASVPPRIDIPREYNAAHDLIQRNLLAGRDQKIAVIDDAGWYTYRQVADKVAKAANALVAHGLGPEDRVMLVHLDGVDWIAAFLGCIQAGIVPLATNTLFTTRDYQALLVESRAKAVIVSDALYPTLAPAIAASPFVKSVIVSGQPVDGTHHLQSMMRAASAMFTPFASTRDDVCFWLFSSGSTGTPKGTLHIHSSLISTAELYARPILGIRETDTVFSAAKLFFAYGLGNALTFPFAVGATTVLMAERATPTAVFKRLTEQKPTIFYGVPTLFAGLLASPELPAKEKVALRVCTSAGEALPAEIGKRWTQHFGVEILDGIGSTEMLHIFLSNRPGEVRYGTTGKVVPGYRVRIVDENGGQAQAGELGDLYISGPSAAIGYWGNVERSRATFQGEWTRSGDKYSVDADGYYTYGGRSDDMLKVSGIYVSPFEVEAALLTHASVLEAAVVGREDDDCLVKPKAFIVLKQSIAGTDALADELKAHVKSLLAPYKYPRWIEFVAELPKTATGKIQRFKLRV